MLENDLFPLEAMEDLKVKSYWDHMQKHLPWAHQLVSRYGSKMVPLWLWGDDARYMQERTEKIAAVCLGAVLDDRSSSVVSVWPLFCYRVETWFQTSM